MFYYAWGEGLVDPADPEGTYAERLLKPKLAVELAYIQRATLLSDIAVIIHTALAIAGQAIGKAVPPSAKDIRGAARWVPAASFDGLA